MSLLRKFSLKATTKSVPHVATPEGHVGAKLALDDEERKLIFAVWKDDFESLWTVGAAIYTEIFSRSPDARQLFPGLARHGDRWKESREFRSQALRFVQVLSICFKELLQKDEPASEMLVHVGFMHRRFRERGFRAEHWDVFREGVVAAVTQQTGTKSDVETNIATDDELKRGRLAASWRILTEYIIGKMREGFELTTQPKYSGLKFSV